jgi:fused signal recognition particle receptor
MAFFQKIKDKFARSQDKDKYLTGLKPAKKTFGDRLRTISNNYRGIDDELLEEIMVLLLESDMGIHTAQKVVDEFEARSKTMKDFASMEDYLISILYDFYDDSLDLPVNLEEKPAVIFMVGVNGSGKTTTTAKLADYYTRQGKTVALAAADTFRAGAVDQLKEWARRLDVPCVAGRPNQDPSSVVVDACRYVKEHDTDLLIVDTAGRLQNKQNLMRELSKMRKVAAREIEWAPNEVWLVLDATTGQNGISQAKEFLETCSITGIILTKMDGTAKGGIVLGIRDQLELPVRFLGLGETPSDLRPFDISTYLMGITKGLEDE